nr:hypothetical protein Iba_chr15fCG5450 [Ipomoea batatas]
MLGCATRFLRNYSYTFLNDGIKNIVHNLHHILHPRLESLQIKSSKPGEEIRDIRLSYNANKLPHYLPKLCSKLINLRFIRSQRTSPNHPLHNPDFGGRSQFPNVDCFTCPRSHTSNGFSNLFSPAERSSSAEIVNRAMVSISVLKVLQLQKPV